MSEEAETIRERQWNAYFWEPGGKVLRNLYGVKDQGTLNAIEYGMSAARELEIARGDVEIPRTYDADHLRAIHAYLFQDVYEWAGEYRRVPISKELGGDKYEFSPTDLIAPVIDEAAQVARSVDWPATDEAGFAKGMAETYGWLNYAHPFREGNGRAGKVFLQHVAEQSPWQLNFGVLDVPAEPDAPSMKDLWNLTSALTIAQADATGPNAKVMEAVFQNLAEPRAAPAERQETVVTASGLDAALRAQIARRDAAYPAPAAAAVTSTADSVSDLARPRSTPTSYTTDQTLDRDSGAGL